MDATVEWKVLVLFRTSPKPHLINGAGVENEVNNEKNRCPGFGAMTFEEQFGNNKKDFSHKQHNKKYWVAKIYMVIKRCKNTIQY